MSSNAYIFYRDYRASIRYHGHTSCGAVSTDLDVVCTSNHWFHKTMTRDLLHPEVKLLKDLLSGSRSLCRQSHAPRPRSRTHPDGIRMG